ncbi:uncharacterized protein LY89DRAFT_789506 [Mollisia scopiformis]|uniref:Uncharacterized protein n=1 Tax=Mollisia scopiformis TaxID=149040 RepID=A0A132B7I4_MOLSC|nr:uncharacterized protein LY89DRAFT_789506 [Mollisia scopiformis]KUJ07844.1 hypothetical protein LY89DRAFT_789506 [Mollisia scopiformis]
MKKTFQFVDGSGAKVDKVTRKSIRSHVMKDRNAGKTVHRRSRLELPTPCDDSRKEARKSNEEDSGPVARNLGNVLRTFPFPVELSESSLKSIDQFFIFITEKMYPSQLGLSSDGYKHDWLVTTFIDADAAYCSLALMASTNAFFSSGGISSSKALSYLSNTFSLVQRRMQGEEALSDSTLCMVMMLILQEQIRHEKASRIHYEGLRKLIELRGGLSRLKSCSTLLLKMSKMDILYALRYGEPVLFYRDRMSEIRSMLPSIEINYSPGATSGQHQYDGINTDLRDILVDVMSIAALFNSPPSRRNLDIKTFLEIVISICCRLIRFRPLQSPKPECRREAAYHIGLITFMTTLFLQWDNRRIQGYHLISRRLREVLDEEFDARDDDNLLLWLLFVASLWFKTTSVSYWLVLRIRRLAVRFQIDSWSRVCDSICQFPWINILHDQTGRAVWDLVYQGPPDGH